MGSEMISNFISRKEKSLNCHQSLFVKNKEQNKEHTDCFVSYYSILVKKKKPFTDYKQYSTLKNTVTRRVGELSSDVRRQICGVVRKVCWSPSIEISLDYSLGSIVSKDFKLEVCHGFGTEICKQNKRQSIEKKRVRTISEYPARRMAIQMKSTDTFLGVFKKASICSYRKLMTFGQRVNLLFDEWLYDLAFLIDITSHPNPLNVNLHGRDNLFTDLCDHVSVFRLKLQLFVGQLEARNLTNSPPPHESDTEQDNVIRFTNPLVFPNNKVCLLEPNLQQEVIEIKGSSVIRSKYMEIPASLTSKDMIQFWLAISVDQYPHIRSFARRYVCRFGSTYRCYQFCDQ
ncbi:hypothetical protein RF11_12484 [Thelohanellus kitauei]|uniref:Uncharacterized protein n=1 Tax=Thelohanellus kitauei TaxID=669202 RepID=A0A0C2MPK2_THEKT|nr:hypothetical protein RF11_12484 [Thelohanellus kitauei]